jgi:hypothetical protein
MASTFCSGDAACGTMALENPFKYWRMKNSLTPDQIVAASATASNALLSHHTGRNGLCAFNDLPRAPAL